MSATAKPPAVKIPFDSIDFYRISESEFRVSFMRDKQVLCSKDWTVAIGDTLTHTDLEGMLNFKLSST